MKEYNGKPLVEGLLEEIEYVYKSDKRPWVIGYSGGKDSTVVVHLVYQKNDVHLFLANELH